MTWCRKRRATTATPAAPTRAFHSIADIYHAGDDVHANASLAGANGDAFVTLESALDVQTSVLSAGDGRAGAQFRVNDAPGDLRVGAAFVHDGAIEWTSVPLEVDAPGRPQFVPLDLGGSDFAPGASANVALRDARPGPGTVVVRVSRGAPSGSALFDTAPSLLAVGLTATEVSAPSGQTWHPWVDSTGQHAQVIGFERRGASTARTYALAGTDTGRFLERRSRRRRSAGRATSGNAWAVYGFRVEDFRRRPRYRGLLYGRGAINGKT